MDLKKLFEYEHSLETLRPEFSNEENYLALMQPDAVTEMVSFNVSSGAKEGVFIKLASKDGARTKLTYLNPVLAKKLVREIFDSLTAQGFDMSDEDNNSADPYTYH